MAAVELFEKWSVGGPWEYTAPVSVDANGVLTVDANAHGVTSMYPCLAEPHYVFVDGGHANYNLHDRTRMFEFSLSFATAGVVTFGFLAHPSIAASHHSKYEFSYDGTVIRFFAKGASNWDNTTAIPSNKIKVRIGFQQQTHSIAVCSDPGVLIAEDTTNTDQSLDYDLVRNLYYETSNSAFQLIFGPSSSYSYAICSTPFITVRSGSVVFSPTRIVTEVSEGNSYAVKNGTSATIRTKPATPSIGVTNYQNGLDSIELTSLDANTSIVMSRNRGAFVTTAQDVIEDVLRIQCSAGNTKKFSSTRPSVFRAIAHNGLPSDMVTRYVGPTTAVAIPEISISRWSVGPSNSGCVKMYCTDQSASIRFTVDGTEPTASSMLYTEPLFVKGSTFLRAKSFSGASSSITVNATYIASGLAIPNPYDTSLWVYNGNASFTASSLTVTDPTGIGVAFREDAYEQSSYDTSNDYGGGATSFSYVTSFNVSGPFRLKVPGTAAHMAWVGNTVGLVADTSTAPTTSMGGAVTAKVTITGNTYDSTSYSYKNVVKVIGYDSGGTQVASVTLKYSTQPIGTYTNVLSFTSEGISPFTITNLSLTILSAVGASIDTGIPLIDTVSAHNIAGAPAPTASTSDSSVLAAWDIDKNWPLDYKQSISWRVEDLQGVENGYRSDNMLAINKEIKAYHNKVTADAGAAWFTSRIDYGAFIVPILGSFYFGWANQQASTPAIRVKKAAGVSTEMDVNGMVGGSAQIDLVLADAALTGVTSTLLKGVKGSLMWRCGRKTAAGRLMVRTALLDDGSDPQYNPAINNIIYDSGWVDAGATPSVLPRPVFFMRGPMLAVSGLRESNSLGAQQASVLGGLTDDQVESCMLFGSPSSLPTPTLAVGAQASDGTYPVTATCAGASSVLVCAGSKPLQKLGGAAANRWSVASGVAVSVPEVSIVQSVGVGSGDTACSQVATTYVGRDTADYISVTTRPGVALIRVLPRTKAYSPPTGVATETLWSLWLNGVRMYEIDLSAPGDIEINLEAGTYSALIKRELRAGRNAGVVGSTPTPLNFTVTENLDVTVVAPTTVVAGAVANFTASATSLDATWDWRFSDGTAASTASTTATFAKPGKYLWSVTAKSASGEIVQRTGAIIATFAPGLVIPTTRTLGVQERVS